MGWPLVGMPLMVLLGLGVRGGSTPVDAWMQQAHGTPLGDLLFFTDPRTMNAVLATTVLTALYRKLWLLAPLAIGAPWLGMEFVETVKPWFDRFKGTALSYPSGHTTVMVVVLGMLILAVGVRRWLVWAAAAFAALGMVGQSVTYHYFTDTVGAVLLGTSLVCVAALILRWVRRRTYLFRSRLHL